MQYELYSYDQIDSTNEEAKRFIAKGERGNFIITAKEQIKGKGREDRQWLSPIGNLYVSIGLDLDIAPERQTDFCFIAGLSMVESVLALDNKLKNNIRLKWPNDLMINDKKAAGILLESIQNYLIIGIGININSNPINIGKATTNLLQEGIKTSSDKLLKILIKNFEKYLLLWQDEGFFTIRELWIKNAYKLNQEISFNYQGEKIIGIFTSIDQQGNIILQDAKGEIRSFVVEEIF